MFKVLALCPIKVSFAGTDGPMVSNMENSINFQPGQPAFIHTNDLEKSLNTTNQEKVDSEVRIF